MKDYNVYSEQGFTPCGDEYVETIGTFIIMFLKTENMTKGVRVSINKQQAKVQIGIRKRVGGFWEQTTDCQAAFESKQDPEFVARTAVQELIENINRARAELN